MLRNAIRNLTQLPATRAAAGFSPQSGSPGGDLKVTYCTPNEKACGYIRSNAWPCLQAQEDEKAKGFMHETFLLCSDMAVCSVCCVYGVCCVYHVCQRMKGFMHETFWLRDRPTYDAMDSDA